MSDASRKAEMERLAKLREAMSDAALAELQARFKADPKSLSLDEADFLYLVTREKIYGFEDKARRRQEKGGGSEDPNSTK
jgi:hypothetical protein